MLLDLSETSLLGDSTATSPATPSSAASPATPATDSTAIDRTFVVAQPKQKGKTANETRS